MPQVAAALGAIHLGPGREERAIGLSCHSSLLSGLVEARPARPRFELRLGAEQLRAASGAAVAARPMLVPEFAGERALRALLSKHVIPLRTQLLAPLRIAL